MGRRNAWAHTSLLSHRLSVLYGDIIYHHVTLNILVPQGAQA